MKRRKINYQKLWTKGKVLQTNHDKIYLKKEMDDLCLRADLQENTLDYVKELCLGMHELSLKGLKSKHFQYHPILLQKLLSMGKDLMDKFYLETDAFYLGVFLELKLANKWHERGFFNLLVKVIGLLRQNTRLFSNAMKDKIITMLKDNKPGLYHSYIKPIAS